MRVSISTLIVVLSLATPALPLGAQSREQSVADSSPFRALDLPTPNDMRAPGEAIGMLAMEASARPGDQNRTVEPVFLLASPCLRVPGIEWS